MEKVCTKCKEIKPLEKFSKRNTKSGYYSWCMPCNHEYGKKYYQDNKNKERQKLYLKNRRLSAFGLDSESFDKILESQNGLCAICKVPSLKTLHVDHNHSSGKVRGLLCFKCNVAVGLLKDNIENTKSLLEYLIRSEDANYS